MASLLRTTDISRELEELREKITTAPQKNQAGILGGNFSPSDCAQASPSLVRYEL